MSRTLITLGIVLVGILSISTAVRSQAPQNVWEYASVALKAVDRPDGNGRDEVAGICYAIPQGCRYEPVSITPSSEGVRFYEGYMAATAKLGAQGWELTTATDSISPHNRLDDRVLYFRRLKK